MSTASTPDYNAFILSIATKSAQTKFDRTVAIAFISDANNRRHPLLPLLCQLLIDHGETDLPEVLRIATYQTIARTALIREAEKEIHDISHQHNIPLHIYKGSALAAFHPYPDLRPQADIDIATDTCHIEKLHEILIHMRYKPCWANHYHMQYSRAPFHYEIHTRLVSYKYELFFGLKPYRWITQQDAFHLTSEDYIILSCLKLLTI